jgi:DNA repair exonuclease SbcCD nuclease subunit
VSFRFLHTADWQAGKPFGNVPGDAGAALRRQRIDTIANLAKLATEQQVDAVLVAGDAFDSNEVEDRTINQVLAALSPFAGPWIFLPGNHDAALPHSVWSRLRRLSSSDTIIIADRPEPIELQHGSAVILPAPLRRRRESSDLTAWFDAAATRPGAIRVGLAHGSVANRLPAGSEAANTIAEDRAQSADLDYLALGDWHGTLQIADKTWYSGTPETDRHRDNQSGNVLVVEIDGHGAVPRVTAMPTGAYAWRRVEVGLIDGRAGGVSRALEGLEVDHQRAVVELTVTGIVSLAERHAVELELSAWRARLHHLVVDDAGLREEPTDDDLDAIGAGFVGHAVERLRAISQEPAHQDRDAARVALRMLFLDHMNAKGSQ